ncbi:NAD-dependent epimerase/dehydratase family protein [Listeria booriae]|uniref:NAD-dependent epimerase/dehydratase family protein n=1 Tax=Listeria booriae TaxID=1552123 RepID=UPI001625DE5C|nr:NAD-dependent epimerase/dehydratase family protein [Listeria booriae]MBC2036933.1 NAD-dependent epimerase/dehydratase family protein [Listeria booriae]
MSKKRILITGGCGFIGSRVVRNLLATEHEIFVIDDLSSGNRALIPEMLVDLMVCDIRSVAATEHIREIAPHCVIHLAAQIDVQVSMEQQLLDADINVMGTLNMIEACKGLAEFERFVFASTAAVYGNNLDLPLIEDAMPIPISPYGMSKWIGEQYLELNGTMANFPYCALRFANVYGDKETRGKDVISNFWSQIADGKSPIIYGDGEQTRDFIYVEDIAEALILALDVRKNGIYNISTNEQTSINDVLRVMNELLEMTVMSENRPERDGDLRDSRLSNRKFRDAAGWQPMYTLAKGLAQLELEKRKHETVLVK